MYQKDKDGREYRVLDTFVRAWSAQMPGWSVCEVRQFDNGSVVVHVFPAMYVKDNPDESALHAIYMLAAKGLGR
jgi:hypothetical protein